MLSFYIWATVFNGLVAKESNRPTAESKKGRKMDGVKEREQICKEKCQEPQLLS